MERISVKQREQSYDYLRCLSCIAIVLLHVSGSYWSIVNRESSEFTIMTVYNALTRFAVPTFMMLSGAFLLEEEKEMSIGKCLKRFAKLVFNFYVWSAFYAFQGLLFKFVTGKNITQELWTDSWERFFWGHYHMWFVFLILGFYLLLPIIRKFVENKAIIEYFLVLWGLTRYFIPSFVSIGKLSLVNVWINKLEMNMFIGYLGYFILGYYIRKYGFRKQTRIIIYIAGAISVLYSVFQTITQSRIQEMYVESYFSPSSWNVVLYSMAVFTFFANLKREDKSYTFVGKVSRGSFIVYMVHPFFIEKFNMIGVTTISFNCLLSIPILTVIIFICSFLVATIIKSIPRINKLLI